MLKNAVGAGVCSLLCVFCQKLRNGVKISRRVLLHGLRMTGSVHDHDLLVTGCGIIKKQTHLHRDHAVLRAMDKECWNAALCDRRKGRRLFEIIPCAHTDHQLRAVYDRKRGQMKPAAYLLPEHGVRICIGAVRYDRPDIRGNVFLSGQDQRR